MNQAFWETTMDPQIGDVSGESETPPKRTKFLNSDGPEVEPRKRFIQAEARSVANLDVCKFLTYTFICYIYLYKAPEGF
jgi:DNA gyrase/topoisomerase IV subunit B